MSGVTKPVNARPVSSQVFGHSLRGAPESFLYDPGSFLHDPEPFLHDPESFFPAPLAVKIFLE
jgi:hypothetical protein